MSYGGGTVGHVNTATGNLVLQHEASAIGAPGFTVDLTHTFNGQDPYGQKKTNPDSWAVYGEGWSFSQDLRLFEIQGGDATVFKDGTGRIRVFTQLDIVSGTRTHTAPIQYGYTLVKDVNNPVADANKVWTLTATSGGEKLFFDANGKLKRREDRNGNHLTYAYDGSDRLSTITDEIGRTTTFTWTAPGSPNRLYRITDMAGRIFEYGYDSYGNLITIKDAVGTSVQRTTTYGYAVADQLATVTNPNGNQSVIDYGNLHGWESSTTESWQMAAGSTGTVVKSTDRAYTGSGSLKATLGSAGVPLNSEIVRPYSPAKSWNSAPQEMIAWIWLSSGAPAINVTMRASNNCSSGTQSVTAALTANAWNEVHLESVDQDPTCPLTELGLRFQTPGGQSYTTPIYVDHMYMRGLTVGVREASGAHTIFQEWSWDPANRQTTIGLRDAAGTMQPTTHRYTEVGQVDRITDPYSDVTTMVFDGDWRMTSITYPGSPTRTDTHTYPTGRMEPLTSTIDGDTSRMGVDATSGDLRYEIDPVNEARRAASQAFVATIHDRDAAGNVTSTKLNWYAAGANLDTIPFPTATSTLETTSYTYTANGETATTTDPRGIVARDEWDTAGRHTKHIDNFVSGGSGADQNLTTTNVYDTTIIAGKAGWVSQTTDPIGAVTALTYDALGHQLTSTTTGTGLGSGITVTTTTDANGSVTTETLDGIVTERTHDVNGRPTKVVVDKGTGKLNLTTEHAYDLQGNQIATKDPRGTIGRSWYDANGRLTRTVQNCTTTGTTIPTAWETCTGLGTADATWNLTTTYGYDAQGNQTSEIAPNGRETRHGYDVKGQRVWTTENFVSGTPTSADQNLTTWFYTDDRGRDVATKAPTTDRTTFIVTRRVYDEHGRVMSEIVNCTDSGTTPPADPATCTGAGTVNATTNITTTYAYDAAGNQLAMTAPKPSDGAAGTSTVTTRYAHDGGGRLCRVLENATVDLQSLAVPCTTAVTGTTTSDLSTRYTYDAGGNMTSMVDARGNTQSYAYDAAGRMTGRTDGLSASVAWTYDKRGNRLTQANRVGSPAVAITWTYDSANRMKTRVADLVTTTYGYDANGSLTSAQGPAGTMSTTFDRLDRPTSVTPDDGSANTTWSYSFTAPSRADASGTSTFALDKHGRETSATLPLSASAFTTAYRADGSPSTRTDPNANTTTHGYDTIGRLLTKVTTGSGGTPTRASLTYTYNRASQRLSEASTVTGDPANGTASFTYDAIGRLTAYTSPLGTGSNQAYGWQKVPNRDSLTIGTGTPSTLTYDAADRMTTSGYTHDADGRMTGQPGQTLVWDSLGRLKELRNSSTNALISAYTYDALDRLRTVARGSTIRFRYVGTSTQVSEVVDNGTNASQLKVGNGWGGERLATWTGTSSTPRYLGTNGHGDVTWSTDGSGAVVNTLRYDPWGNVAAASGSGLPDWRFQGSWNDTSTGLSWVVTRWYAPGLGRFVSEDSLLGEPRNPMSRHLIAYAEGDPVGGWDPDGRQTACTVDIKWVWLSCEGIKIGLVALAALATAVGTVIVSKIAANPPAVIAIPRYKYVVYPIDYYKFDTKLKCANIGERQSRVNLFTWLIAPCHTMPRIIGKMPRPEKLGLNQLWISQQIRARSIINDIGPCVSPPSITSPYYGLERGSIRAAGYPRLTWFGDNNPWEAPPPFAGGDCPYVP